MTFAVLCQDESSLCVPRKVDAITRTTKRAKAEEEEEGEEDCFSLSFFLSLFSLSSCEQMTMRRALGQRVCSRTSVM